MKIKTILSCILAIFFSSIYAQRGASAEVEFEYFYQGYSEEELEYLPQKSVCLVSGSNYKKITVDDDSTFTQVIFNADSLFMAELKDIDGRKEAFIYHKDDIEKLTSNLKIKVKKTKSYKLIKGYLSYKYLVTIKNTETKEKKIDEVYATTEIGGKNLNFVLYDGVEGFILSSKKMEENKVIKMKVVQIEKRPISDKEFLISDDYSLTTFKQQMREK